jgi:hypothetical protein
MHRNHIALDLIHPLTSARRAFHYWNVPKHHIHSQDLMTLVKHSAHHSRTSRPHCIINIKTCKQYIWKSMNKSFTGKTRTSFNRYGPGDGALICEGSSHTQSYCSFPASWSLRHLEQSKSFNSLQIEHSLNLTFAGRMLSRFLFIIMAGTSKDATIPI